MQDILYRDPTTAAITLSASAIAPSVTLTDSDFDGDRQETAYLQAQATIGSTRVTAKLPIHESYVNLLEGGEHVPHAALQGIETALAADIAADATSMTVLSATQPTPYGDVNLFVADRPYLLMNRKPAYPGEDIFQTGADADGVAYPSAEVITVDSGYTDGTTITIARGATAVARKRMAVIQGIPGVGASYGALAKGLKYEMERPTAITMGTCADSGSQRIKAVFLRSAQEASAGGVVTHYAVYCLKRAGATLDRVKTLFEHCPPSQVLDGTQVDAVFRITDAHVVNETISTVVYATVDEINRYFDPATGALSAITAGTYWVGVAAMNQATFDKSLRMSRVTFSSVVVA